MHERIIALAERPWMMTWKCDALHRHRFGEQAVGGWRNACRVSRGNGILGKMQENSHTRAMAAEQA